MYPSKEPWRRPIEIPHLPPFPRAENVAPSETARRTETRPAPSAGRRAVA